MRVLEALDRASPRDPPLYVEPALRIWLATHGLIAATEPPVAPSDERRRRRPVRRHDLTDRGRAVLAAAAGTDGDTVVEVRSVPDLEHPSAVDPAPLDALPLDALLEMLYVASSHGDRSLVPAALDRLLEYLDHWGSSSPGRIAALFDRLDPSRLVRAVGQTLLAWTRLAGDRSAARREFLARFLVDLRIRGTPEATISRLREGIEVCLQCGDPLHCGEPLSLLDNSNPGLGGCHARCVAAYHLARERG